MHDYTAKRGVEACFILAPKDAPDWAQDRAALWNAAEARETRSNSVTAREWELALPSELSDAARIDIARAFAAQLVELRYFGGYEEAEIAQMLGLSDRTVRRDWRKARAFLLAELQA